MAVAVTAVVCLAVGMVGVGLLAATLPALKWLARAGEGKSTWQLPCIPSE